MSTEDRLWALAHSRGLTPEGMEIVMGNDNPRVTATDDEALAKRLGFTEWDADLGQWVAPAEPATPDEGPDPEGGPEGGPATPPPSAPPAEPVNYDAWKVDELRAELGRRDLPNSGAKAELAARLVEHDKHTSGSGS
jgi:hypothetical protein